MPAPTNTDAVIDSRDVIARIDELEGELAALNEAIDEAAADDKADAIGAAEDWLLDNHDELNALQALAAEAADYADDWQHGATLVSLEYWPTYAQELVEDIGDLPRNIPSYIVIDWEATAGNLQADYTEVDFDGATYLVR